MDSPPGGGGDRTYKLRFGSTSEYGRCVKPLRGAGEPAAGSFRAAERDELAELVSRLPKPGAVHQLRELGFTTVVVNKRSETYARNFRRRVLRGTGVAVRPLRENTTLAAYSLESPR